MPGADGAGLCSLDDEMALPFRVAEQEARLAFADELLQESGNCRMKVYLPKRALRLEPLFDLARDEPSA